MQKILKTALVSATLILQASLSNASSRYMDNCWIAMNQERAKETEMVNTILTHKGKIYIGGDFIQIGSDNAKYVAQWDGTKWIPIGNSDSLRSNLYTTVNAVAFDSSGNLYIGGYIGAIGSVGVDNIAKWNGSTWDSLQSGITETINSITYNNDNGHIYAAGFVHIDHRLFTSYFCEYVWEWNDTSLSFYNSKPIGECDDGCEYCPYYGLRISKIDYDKKYTLIQSNKNHPEFVDHIVQTFTKDCYGSYYAVTFYSDCLWCENTQFDELIVRKKGDSLGTRDSILLEGGLFSRDENPKNAIVVDKKGNVYVGGCFSIATQYGDAYNIIMWDGEQLYPLGSGVNGTVNALALSEDENTLYVGGDFDKAGGKVSPMIAAVDLRKRTGSLDRSVSLNSVVQTKLRNKHLLLTGLAAQDKIIINNLKGQQLLQMKAVSNINLEKLIPQPLIVSIVRESKMISRSMILLQ